MTKGSVCVCGPRPKGSVTGLSLAVELLLEGLDKAELTTRVVDAAFGGNVQNSGTFSIRRSAETVSVILSVWWNLLFVDVYYTTLSTSTFGFIRDFATGIVARLLGKRVVFHLHGGGFEDFYCAQRPVVQFLVRFLYKKVDTVVVLGELLKDQFYCLGDFVKPKLVIVPNGLTLGVDDPGRISRSLKTPMQLLYISSLMETKGYIEVIDAVAEIVKKSENSVHLSLCGSFVSAKTETKATITDEESLMEYLRGKGVSSNVTYYGQVLADEKCARFREADVFLLPTSYPWEGQPLSIIEAMAYSLPVISCAHKGIPELVEDRVNGFLVDPHSPTKIANALMELQGDSASYQSMSQYGRERYEKQFTRAAHLQQLIAVIFDCNSSQVTLSEF